MNALGLVRNLFRSSKVQVPPLAFMAAEKLKPLRPSPRLSPTMPQRLGPTRLGPFFSKVWQVWQTFAAACPFSAEAVCRSFSIGSDGSAFAGSLPPPVSSLAAMAKPGFSRGWGANHAFAAKFVTSRTMQVASTAPSILLISKESISDQAPGRKGSMGAALPAAGIARESQFESHFRSAPKQGRRYRFAPALATRINAPAFGQSPLFPACYRTTADRPSDDPQPHSGADSGP